MAAELKSGIRRWSGQQTPIILTIMADRHAVAVPSISSHAVAVDLFPKSFGIAMLHISGPEIGKDSIIDMGMHGNTMTTLECGMVNTANTAKSDIALPGNHVRIKHLDRAVPTGNGRWQFVKHQPELDDSKGFSLDMTPKQPVYPG